MKRNKVWYIYNFLKICGDIIFSIIIFYLAYYIRFYNEIFTSIFPPIKGIPQLSFYHEFVPFYVLVTIFAYTYCGYYKKVVLDSMDEFVSVTSGSITLGILLLAVGFFYRGYEYSRMFIVIIMVITIPIIYLWHQVIKRFYLRYIKYLLGKPRIGIIGEDSRIKNLKDKLTKNKNVRTFVLDIIDSKDEILKFLEEKNISELIVDYPYFNNEKFQEIIPEIDSMGIEIKISIDVPVRLSDTTIDSTLGLPVITIKPLSLSMTNFFVKRTMDIIVSILVLSILFVPLMFISILIKIDSEGPVLFVQDRVGFKGRKFKCYKFRTMFVGAHKVWWQLLKQSIRGEKVFKLKDDPRVTRVGKILRQYSLDEIPQFFNVLKGDMSIVGPRPQIVEEVSFYDSYAKRRLMIIPGLTGLWQVSGRADVSYDDMIKLDIYYLENWSLGLDLKIMYKTFSAIFSKKGAY
jgi:exopolysaccharide biosynthesis polyprenyl glycosylphosphotransferase